MLQGKELLILCEKCGQNIPDSQFRKHKIEHQLGKIPEGTDLINPATGKPDGEPLTPPPEIKPAPVVPVKGTEIPKTTDTPIKLKYVYEGTCYTCGTEVETIPLDISVDELTGEIKESDSGKVKRTYRKVPKFVVIAWCPTEKRNIQQRIVAKI